MIPQEQLSYEGMIFLVPHGIGGGEFLLDCCLPSVHFALFLFLFFVFVLVVVFFF
jgi:hypothetical protein